MRRCRLFCKLSFSAWEFKQTVTLRYKEENLHPIPAREIRAQKQASVHTANAIRVHLVSFFRVPNGKWCFLMGQVLSVGWSWPPGTSGFACIFKTICRAIFKMLVMFWITIKISVWLGNMLFALLHLFWWHAGFGLVCFILTHRDMRHHVLGTLEKRWKVFKIRRSLTNILKVLDLKMIVFKIIQFVLYSLQQLVLQPLLELATISWYLV